MSEVNFTTPSGLTAYTNLCSFGASSVSSVETDITPHLTSDYTQTRNGTTTDLSGSLAHFVQLRSKMDKLEMKIEDFVVDGRKERVASRHLAWGTLKDGTAFSAEVCLFIDVDGEGRARRIVEVSRSV